MAFFHSQPSVAITFLSLLLLTPTTLSQGPPLNPAPTVPDCASRLLPLTPCAPFVQGISQFPAQSCCNNLKQLSIDQPGCICVLLNNTNLSSFPINSTLALQLPALCNIQVNVSACSEGFPEVPSNSPASEVPSNSPASQVSLGAHANPSHETHNSTVAASPMIEVAPRPTIMGFGLGRSVSVKMKARGPLVLLVTLAAILFTKVISGGV